MRDHPARYRADRGTIHRSWKVNITRSESDLQIYCGWQAILHGVYVDVGPNHV